MSGREAGNGAVITSGSLPRPVPVAFKEIIKVIGCGGNVSYGTLFSIDFEGQEVAGAGTYPA